MTTKTDDIGGTAFSSLEEMGVLRRELAVERARSRTQASLAQEFDMIPEALGQMTRSATIHRRIVEALFAASPVVILACPDCGNVWHARPGESSRSGYRLCNSCLGDGDPWR
jgi:hypothetical protein